MALLSSARLRRNQERLRELRFLPATDFAELELLEVLAATIEDLHSFYPAYVPETKQYALLQQLALLDVVQESQRKNALFLTVPANWLFAQQTVQQAIAFALAQLVYPAASPTITKK